jgi:hypothetical protein
MGNEDDYDSGNMDVDANSSDEEDRIPVTA